MIHAQEARRLSSQSSDHLSKIEAAIKREAALGSYIARIALEDVSDGELNRICSHLTENGYLIQYQSYTTNPQLIRFTISWYLL